MDETQDQSEIPEVVETPEIPEVVVEPAEPVTPDFTSYNNQVEARIHLERENAELRLKNTPAPTVKDEDPMPDPVEYEGRELEFTRDLNRWDARKTAREEFTRLTQSHAQTEKENSARTEIQKAQDNYKTQVAAEIAADPTLQKALNATANVPLTEGRDYFIASSPVAGKIAKHLAKTPGELVKYASMPVDQALKYIGRLEGKFETAETSVVKVSKAPAPHAAIENAAGGAAGKYKAGDGADAYLRQFYPEMYE